MPTADEWMPAVGEWMFSAGEWLPALEKWKLKAGLWMPTAGEWRLDCLERLRLAYEDWRSGQGDGSKDGGLGD